MGFFDDFGKKISSAGQEAIAKTKDFADIAKLNSNISDEEHRITAAYTEIGKMYFEAHQDDFEECYAGQMTAIKEAVEKIQELKNQIVEIKGVKKCPNCGAELPKTVAFCSSCGTPVPTETVAKEEETVEETVTETKKCANCGETLEEDAAFCANCGTKVEEN